MNDLSRRLREAAAACLPERAFLRRDRGDALFISNAPRLFPEKNWIERFSDAGFEGSEKNSMLRLRPSEKWLKELEKMNAPDPLSESFSGFSGLPIDPESIALFALGARILDGDNTIPGYEKRLRQRAAVCLRSGGGGGLYACAILNHMIKEDNP